MLYERTPPARSQAMLSPALVVWEIAKNHNVNKVPPFCDCFVQCTSRPWDTPSLWRFVRYQLISTVNGAVRNHSQENDDKLTSTKYWLGQAYSNVLEPIVPTYGVIVMSCIEY